MGGTGNLPGLHGLLQYDVGHGAVSVHRPGQSNGLRGGGVGAQRLTLDPWAGHSA